jgi:hypothetical protein
VNPPVVQLLKNSEFHWTQMFITMFTTVLHQSFPEPDQSSTYHPHAISARIILILSTHLHLGLPSGLLPSGFTPISYIHSSSPFVLHALPILDLIILIMLSEDYKLWCLYLSPVSCHFISLRFKHSQHAVLKHPQSMHILQCRRPSFTAMQIYRQKL